MILRLQVGAAGAEHWGPRSIQAFLETSFWTPGSGFHASVNPPLRGAITHMLDPAGC